MIRVFFLIFFICFVNFLHSQTEGIGFSKVYSLNNNVNAMNEALLNAQENAAINAGSHISTLAVEKNEDINIKKNTEQDQSTFQSKRNDLMIEMVKAIVKTIGQPEYDTIWTSNKKYQVKATGLFIVEHENVENLMPRLDELGKTIKVEVQENDCYGRFYDYAKEYFRQKQNSIFLSRQKFPLGETDFGIEVFSDRITLTDKKAAPNYSIKVIQVKNCNDVITNDYSANTILDKIRKEIFYYYLIR